MPQITESTIIEDGDVMGTVKTNRVGSECKFSICSVEEWEELSDEEAQKLATQALFESGQIEYWY
jgi:hypothetical protein